ncbi:hypothetical protein NPS01_42090 [Nocardioides psychrotolerans]|nr:hypothetical protein NPS01_42090 [Nocardioides psychrotolerans]
MVLVTGASSGIGRATVLRAAGDGDHVVLVARGEEALEQVAALARDAGAASALVVTADVGDDDQVRACVATTLRRHDRLDVVVNSAGVVAYGRAEEVPAEVFDGVLRTNLHGSVNVARHVLPVLQRQGAGDLVLVGSVIGHVAVPSMSAYAVSKWGVRALAQHLQLENPDVSILYVAPGGVDTPIYSQAANVAGFEGRPPPPVATPERTARQILARVDGHRSGAQLTLANHLLRFGFTAVHPVYVRIVRPFFGVAAVDLTRPVPPNDGNVLQSVPAGNQLRGDHGNALLGIARNLGLRLRGAARKPRGA